MKGSIAEEEEEVEDSEINLDKHETIVQNIKTHVEGISSSDEEETERINHEDEKEKREHAMEKSEFGRIS